MKAHCQFFVAVHAFFLNGDQVLLLERTNTGYMDGYFSVPAGHVDADETIWEAMQREIMEEVGVEIGQEHLPAHVMHRRSDQERIDYFFVIPEWHGELSNAEPHKSAGISWHNIEQLPQNIVPYVRHAFQLIQEKKQFSELNER